MIVSSNNGSNGGYGVRVLPFALALAPVFVLVLALAFGAKAQEEDPGIEGGLTTVEEDSAAIGNGRPAALLGRTGLPLPRFVSLRAGEVNLRTGPGLRYPIDWVYSRRGLPVEIIDEFDTWRRIRDHEGISGWVHQSMLQGQRTLRVTGETRVLRRARDNGSEAVALVEPGALGVIQACEGEWCQAQFGQYSGWLLRSEFFGSYPHEIFD